MALQGRGRPAPALRHGPGEHRRSDVQADRHEIGDIEPDDLDRLGTYPPPDGSETPAAHAQRIGRMLSALVDMRLGPTSMLAVDPTDAEVRFPPSALRPLQLFGKDGGTRSGARMVGARAEFLYGLVAAVNSENQTTPGQQPRVSELDDLMGRIIGPIADNARNEAAEVGRDWDRVRNAIESRPAALSVWRGRREQPAIFTDGTSFAFRETALHAPPIEEYGERVAAPAISARGDQAGLLGGPLWPIESRNVLDELMRDPRALDGGSLTNLMFGRPRQRRRPDGAFLEPQAAHDLAHPRRLPRGVPGRADRPGSACSGTAPST